jgi:hypothetical protein
MSSARMKIFLRLFSTVEPVLREGDKLEVDVSRDLPLHLQQRLEPHQRRCRDVHVRPDREEPLRHGEVAVAHRPLNHRLDREQRLQLPPERDAFQQRARDVQARQPQAERGVHMEMRVDEGRSDEAAARLDHARGSGLDPGGDARDPAPAHRDIDRPPPVRQARPAQEQVQHHLPPSSFDHMVKTAAADATRSLHCALPKAAFARFLGIGAPPGASAGGRPPARHRRHGRLGPSDFRFALRPGAA